MINSHGKDKMVIVGGTPLVGHVTVSGGKNSAVAIITGTILCDEPCTIDNLPDIEDVHALIAILEHLGAKVTYVPDEYLTVDPTTITSYTVPYKYSSRLRASYYFMGALLGLCLKAKVSYPGGCDIGARPIDQHLKSFAALGANVDDVAGMINISADNLVGGDIFFDFVTVGATMNVMLAAVKAVGSTVIYNAAKEPHIVDLANFLNSMGAKIKGAGTDTIRIKGVSSLKSTNYSVIPDQIETGTLMIMAAATRGDVTIHGCIPKHMESLSAKLLEMGNIITENGDSIRVRPRTELRAINLKTQVYPGFPTDLQQPMTALLCMAKGTSTVEETVFEQRFKHLEEMRRMGIKYKLIDQTVIIHGVNELYGAPVTVTDLRAGAALIVAGLMAKGETEIYETIYIDRGYERIEEKLCSLGANIRREQI